MKTRLLIASIFTVAVALVLAVTLRTSASAQPEPEQPIEAEREDDSPEPVAEFSYDGINTSYRESFQEEDDFSSGRPDRLSADEEEKEIAVWGDVEEMPSSGREELASPEAAIDPEVENGQDDPFVHSEKAEPEVRAELEQTKEMIPAMDFDLEIAFEETAIARDKERETVTVDFPDEEIRIILRLVAEIFELNLVIPESLTGRASIALRNVTWRQVFDVVLSPAGYTYIEDQNIIKVVSVASLSLEPPVTRVVILDYAQAEEIQTSILPMVDTTAGGRIQVDKRSNALVITERPTRLRRIEEIIADLDKPNAQVMIESKFIETRNRHLENIGVDWASLDGWGLRAGELSHRYDRQRSSERSAGQDSGRESFQSNDSTTGTSSSQTSQSTTTSAGGPPTTTSTFGTTAGATAGDSTTSGGGDFSSDFASQLSMAGTARVTRAVFSADQFNVILSALRTSNDVKLVSNPTVVTLNNREARIHIGEEFPVVEARFNQQTGTYEAGAVRNIDIGITLNVTPQVNNAGFINLDVQPDVSTLTGTVNYFGAEYPIRSTRNARTEVTIKDGYTVAIGGLVQEDTVNRETRVPVLGSIPGVGRLFRSENKDNDQRNLIIFLTARTLSPDGSTVEDTVDPRMIHRMGLTREEIPGYRPQIEMWPTPPEAEPSAKVKADVEIESEPDAEIGFSIETEVETEVEAEVETEVEAEVETEVEGEVQTEVEAEVQTEVEGEGVGEAVSEDAADESAGSSNALTGQASETVEEDSSVIEEREAEEEVFSPPPTRRSRSWLIPD